MLGAVQLTDRAVWRAVTVTPVGAGGSVIGRAVTTSDHGPSPALDVARIRMSCQSPLVSPVIVQEVVDAEMSVVAQVPAVGEAKLLSPVR